jgi:hypothetical protein
MYKHRKDNMPQNGKSNIGVIIAIALMFFVVVLVWSK